MIYNIFQNIFNDDDSRNCFLSLLKAITILDSKMGVLLRRLQRFSRRQYAASGLLLLVFLSVRSLLASCGHFEPALAL